MRMIEYLYTGMFLISLVLIYFALKQYSNTKNLIANGIKTKAKVIRLIEVRGDDGYTYKPVFEYSDKMENVRSFESGVSSSPPAYNIGDEVAIIYAKNNDEQKVVSFWGLYRWTVILLSIASPLLIISGCYLLYSRDWL